MRMERVMKAVLFACALLLATLYGAPARANGCGGNLIDHKPVWTGGQKVGELALYYNSANGNNCAVFSHAGPTWGQTLYTMVEVYVCKPMGGAYPTNCAIWQWSPWWSKDAGYYAYRAGPVHVYGQGHCVQAMGYITYRGANHLATSGMHCR